MSEGRAVKEEFRQLARIVEIDDVLPHPNADRLSLAIIGGWQVCVKLDEFKKGDWALYCEIDSLVPTSLPEFAFLEERGDNLKTFNDQTYCRIKSIKLRKEMSQGLLVPIPVALASAGKVEGDDCTEELGVLKYDKSESKVNNPVEVRYGWFHRLALRILGPQPEPLPFPAFLRKSEENRVQNASTMYKHAVANREEFEVTVKLDGESMTVYSMEDGDRLVTGVCSRNTEIEQQDIVFSWPKAIRRWIGLLMLRNRRAIQPRCFVKPEGKFGLAWIKQLINLNRESRFINVGTPKFVRVIKADSDSFLKTARNWAIMEKLKLEYKRRGVAYTVQGEVVGPGIQGNYEGMAEKQFFVYRVYVNGREPLLPEEAREVCKRVGLSYVPVLDDHFRLPVDMKDLLRYAEGPRFFAKSGTREGVVVKSKTRDFSLKIISNKYLLNEK